MACIVGIIFVDESQNFDFEKSGKRFNRRKEKWSWRYKAESDESVVKSTSHMASNRSRPFLAEQFSWAGIRALCPSLDASCHEGRTNTQWALVADLRDETS